MSEVSRLASVFTRETASQESRRGVGRSSTTTSGFRVAMEESGRSATSAPDVGTQSIEAVKKACTDSGMNIAGCNFAYSDGVVWNPWGGYKNPQVQITDANGRLYSFNAELSLKSPQVAAHELRDMMASPVTRDPEDTGLLETAQPAARESAANVDTPVSDLGSTSVDAVRKACAEAGMNTDSLEFNFDDEPVSTPWGGYRDPQVQITLPDGRLFTFSAELSLQNPKLTAFELLQMQNCRETERV
jgi:hypothetical protein